MYWIQNTTFYLFTGNLCGIAQGGHEMDENVLQNGKMDETNLIRRNKGIGRKSDTSIVNFGCRNL